MLSEDDNDLGEIFQYTLQ